MSGPFPLDAEQERFVADILSYMTLEEKLGQLAVLADAPTGTDAAFAEAVATGRIGGIVDIADRDTARAFQRRAVEETRLGIPMIFATTGRAQRPGEARPSGWSRAASWDIATIEALGSEAAGDALTRGSRWLLGPKVVIDRDAAPSDAAICAAEPALVAKLSAAYVRGVGSHAESGRPNVLAGLQCHHIGSDLVSETDPDVILPLFAAIREDCLASLEPLPPVLARFSGIALGSCRNILEIAGGAHDWTVEAAQAAIAAGRLSEGEVEDAVRGVLSVKSALGLFRDPYAGLAPENGVNVQQSSPSGVGHAEDDLARKSIVLLRNRGAILPLGQDLQRILLVGDPEGIAHGCREGLETFGISTTSLPGLALRGEGETYHAMGEHDPFAIALTCDAARRSDVVLMALDEHMFTHSPGRLPRPTEPVLSLIKALGSVGRPIVGIVASEHPVDLGVAAEAFSTIVLAWRSALDCPIALAELLSGEFSPSGRLPVALTSETEAACFPFGHGLGYGETVFSNFSLDCGDSMLHAEIRVHNPGEFPLLETVQLYAGTVGSKDNRLAAFERVSLDPGEARTVFFELGAKELGLPGADGRYRVESGLYRIAIGKSAQRVLNREVEIDESYARAIMLGRPARGSARATGTFGGE